MSSPHSTLTMSSESIKILEDIMSDADIIAKLRRMKIKEDLIIQNIKKNFCEVDSGFIKCDSEYKMYLTNLKTSYADIKQGFDDLKCVTKTQDILQNSDIDEIKKDVLDLDEKIKKIKTFLQKELNSLKSTEKDLLEQKKYETSHTTATKYTKISSKTYRDIVPSPVRNIINSPFKHPEVQKFQDFLSHSQKRGGWNEYNHNIFIRLWQKHFQNEEDFIDYENLDKNKINLFINDVSDNVPGIKKAEITSHMNWYSQYLSLKKQQQLAINEWRAKNKPNKVVSQPLNLRKENEISCLRRSHAAGNLKMTTFHSENDAFGDLICPISKSSEHNYNSLVDTSEFLGEMEKVQNSKCNFNRTVPKFRYTRSTKQWINRCNSSADKRYHINDPSAILKRGVPSWRSKLIE